MSTERDRTSHAAVWITIVVIAVAVYVLSIGPVAGLMENGTIPHSTHRRIENMYAPLLWIAKIPAIRRPLDSYLDWWIEVLRKP